jgi:hypothetical protein
MIDLKEISTDPTNPINLTEPTNQTDPTKEKKLFGLAIELEYINFNKTIGQLDIDKKMFEYMLSVLKFNDFVYEVFIKLAVPIVGAPNMVPVIIAVVVADTLLDANDVP